MERLEAGLDGAPVEPEQRAHATTLLHPDGRIAVRAPESAGHYYVITPAGHMQVWRNGEIEPPEFGFRSARVLVDQVVADPCGRCGSREVNEYAGSALRTCTGCGEHR